MKFHIFRLPKPAKSAGLFVFPLQNIYAWLHHCLSQLIVVPALRRIWLTLFNSMGAEANYSEAGAFHGQSGSLYTGGGLNVRNPVSDVSLANIQLPSISAGCGGIDFFAGSFSFVNKEQFIQFTRNLGNNAAGVAFDLALKALDPMIQDAIGGIRDIVNYVNQNSFKQLQTKSGYCRRRNG